MEISPATLALITTGSTLLGVVVTSLFNLRAARIARDSEERKHQKEIVVKAALENWKQVADMMMKSGSLGMMSPLDVFIIHMVALSGVAFDPTTNADNLKDRLAEVDRITTIASASARDPKPLPRS